MRTSGDTYCAVPTKEFLRDRRLSEGRDDPSPSPPFAPSPSALPFALPSTASEKKYIKNIQTCCIIHVAPKSQFGISEGAFRKVSYHP